MVVWLIPLEEEEEEEEQVNGELAKKKGEYYCKVQRGEFPDTLWGFFWHLRGGERGWLSLLFLVLASCSDKSSEEKEKEKPV